MTCVFLVYAAFRILIFLRQASNRQTEMKSSQRHAVMCASGIAGPSAARGDGQICRPFVLGFGNWRTV